MNKSKTDSLSLSFVMIIALCVITLSIVFIRLLPDRSAPTENSMDTEKESVFLATPTPTSVSDSEIDVKLKGLNKGEMEVDSSMNDTPINNL